MPIKHAAEKALRQTKKAALKNRAVKDAIKKLRKVGARAIAEGKFDEAKALMPKLAQAVDKAAKLSILKQNQANRIKSRFAKALKTAVTKAKK